MFGEQTFAQLRTGFSRQCFRTNGLISYGSGWRKDGVNQHLEFAFLFQLGLGGRVPKNEAWRKGSGKRGWEKGFRKARLGGRVPEIEAWKKCAGKREEGCRKTRLGDRVPENEASRKDAGKRG